MPNRKSADWNSIRAEYIGGASYGALSKKYNISKSTLHKYGTREKWNEQREQAVDAVRTASIKATAKESASNAVVAERIRGKLLKILEREIDALPDRIGTASFVSRVQNGKDDKGKNYTEKTGQEFSLKDLAAVYKSLADDIVKHEEGAIRDDPLDKLLDDLDEQSKVVE